MVLKDSYTACLIKGAGFFVPVMGSGFLNLLPYALHAKSRRSCRLLCFMRVYFIGCCVVLSWLCVIGRGEGIRVSLFRFSHSRPSFLSILRLR